MNKMPGKIPNSLAVALIVHVYIGWGFVQLVTAAGAYLKHNSYMALLLSILFAIPFIFIIHDLGRLFPSRNLTQIFQRVFGKFLGSTLLLILISWIYLVTAVESRISQMMVINYFFINAPFLPFFLIFGGLALYLAWHGIGSIVRFAGFMLIIPLVVFYVLHIFGLANINVLNIKPVFSGSFLNWLKEGFNYLSVFSVVFAIAFLLPYLKNPQDVRKINFISLGLVIPLFFMAIFGTFGVFGPEVVSKLSWGTVEFFRLIDLPFLLLEQAGLFFLITWYGFSLISIIIGFYFPMVEVHHLIPSTNQRLLVLIGGIALFIFAALPVDQISMAAISTKIHPYFVTFIYTIFALLWSVAKLRFGKKAAGELGRV